MLNTDRPLAILDTSQRNGFAIYGFRSYRDLSLAALRVRIARTSGPEAGEEVLAEIRADLDALEAELREEGFHLAALEDVQP